MSYLLFPGLTLALAVLTAACWLGWQLLRQNGRLLLRLEELEKRMMQLELGEPEEAGGDGRCGRDRFGIEGRC